MKKAIIVDDENASVEIIRYFIKKHELPLEICAEAGNGKTAVSLIKKLRPDIVFLDIEMPCMNGIEVMENVRAAGINDVKFIIVSAYESFSYVQHALRLGASDYLVKPLMYEQFCDTMQRVVGYRYTNDPQMNLILEYIEKNCRGEITSANLEAEFFISRSTIVRLFKKHMNCSFIDYCTSVKMRHSKELLDEGKTAAQTAEEMGFSSLSYFYRMFKKHFGITPGEYIDGKYGKDSNNENL